MINTCKFGDAAIVAARFFWVVSETFVDISQS
jgi:hypothetical protein